MESHITPHRIANSIMQNTRFSGWNLIVEGKKDSKIYGKFINKDIVKIKEAFGCGKLIQVIEILNERNFPNKIGIVDADFSRIIGEVNVLENVFYTDNHDIEMTIFGTSALEDVLTNLVGNGALESFLSKKQKPLRDIIFECCYELGLLKLANKINNLGLVFKPKEPDGNQIKYKNFISENQMVYLGREALVETIINYSRQKTDKEKIIKEEIMTSLNEISATTYDEYQLTNGHDVANVIFILIKKTLKCNNKMIYDHNSVEDCFALAYDSSYFIKSKLYSSLFQWSVERGVSLFKDGLPAPATAPT